MIEGQLQLIAYLFQMRGLFKCVRVTSWKGASEIADAFVNKTNMPNQAIFEGEDSVALITCCACGKRTKVN